jgi:hypothetical protein
MDLCVAGLPIRVESADTAFFERRFADYRRDDGREPVLTMHTRRLEHIPVPEGELVQRIKHIEIVRLPDGRFCRFTRGKYPDGSIGPVLFAITYTPDYAEVDIELFERRRHPVFSLTDYEYMYTGASFHNRLAYLGGGVLHSSSIAYNGQGIAFSATSGTGKSTHTGLWKEVFGDAVEIVNDDKPAIWFDGDQAMLCGTRWSGKTALNRNIAVPLRAIVIIERGEENAIRRLDTVDSMFHLTTQISRPYYDEALGIRTLDFTERIQTHVPVCCLTCNISHQAVQTVFHEIFPQEGMI